MNVVYIRTSSKEQNPQNQLKDILSLVGDVPYDLYEDKQSAWKDNVEREEFSKVRKLIKSNKVGDLYVWDLDRIYRNRKRTIEFFRFCKVYNCNVHSFRQAWLEKFTDIPEPFNEIMYDMMLNIMAWLGEEESNKKSDRVKNAVRRGEGEKTISYKGNDWGRPELSPLVIAEVLKFKDEGLSIRKIAEKVFYWDKNNNKKNISKSGVHKIISENKP